MSESDGLVCLFRDVVLRIDTSKSGDLEKALNLTVKLNVSIRS